MIKKNDVKEMYFLSPMQEGMLFHYLMDKKSTVYFEQMAYRIYGEIQYKLFEQAFCYLIERYDILRTIFVYEKVERSVQVVLRKRNASLYYQDISLRDDDEKIKIIKDFKINDKERGFDLSKDLLIRLSIFKIAEQTYEIIWSFHHIILDGWSVGIIYADFLRIYQKLLNGAQIEMEPVKEYKEYIKWLENQDINKGMEYWKNYLEGYRQPAIIPKGYNSSPTGEYKREKYRFLIDESTTRHLINLTLTHKVTLNTIFQVLWGVLLKKYNNTEDVVFGVIVSGRPLEIEGIDQMVGIFLNNIPIRIPLEDDDRFSQLVRKIQERELLSRSYEYVPLDQIQARSYLKRSLIDHIMDFGNYPLQDLLKNMNNNDIGFTIKEVSIYEQTNYDFVIIISPREEIIVDFQYNALVYDTHLVNQIASHYRTLISRAVEDPQISIGELKKISRQREEEMLTYFNEYLEKEAGSFLQEDETLQGQLLEHFRRYSNKSAVEYGNRTITYAKLEKKARAAAQWIIHNGIEKETIIGILLEDRMELIASVLGILLAGCAIAPFYSSYPEKRIETMICSTDIQYIIIDEHNYRRFENSNFLKNLIFIFPRDLYSSELMKTHRLEDLRYSPGDKMYIHFTSGSTGNPKAIMGKNSSLLHFIRWEIETFGITGESNRTAQFTIPGFDPFLRDIFVPLLSGGVICIPENSDTVLHSPALRKWINEHRISLIHCVSSLFRQLSSETLAVEDFPVLQAIMLAGEKITPEDVVKWYKTFGERIQLANCYGPTETTMSKICYFIRAADVNRERIPIGKPIQGARVIILDEQMNICDTLEVGEIFIRTPYRSFGYYNDNELNREKFIRNPFSSDPGDILYRSGDLGRFLPDGNIDILGRVDRQVKIRGYRVELEEIEHALTRFPQVKEAAVIKQEVSINNELLCAFISPSNHQETGQERLNGEINQYLTAKLPDYMVPAKIITVENLPRKATGKVDEAKLRELFQQKSVDHTIPRDSIEERLSLLWSDVLRIENIGRLTRFFDLGGSSLNVMTLISRIHKAFDLRISLVDFFNNPTIERQAGLIRGTLKREIYNSIKNVEEKEFYRLSPGQKRLYALQQMDPAGTAYNLPSFFKLEGYLDRQRLEKIFRQLIHRHESLRTSFDLIEGEPAQRINRKVNFQMEYHESEEHNKDIQKIQKSFIRAFDLSRAPLTRMGLIKIREMEFILMVDIHHIVADGTSLGIMVSEFMGLYADEELPFLRLQYKDFSEWQSSKEYERLKENQEEYWLKEFEGFEQLEPLNLWPDFKRPELPGFEGDVVSFEIDSNQMEALKSTALKEGLTLFSILFTIYAIMLAIVSGQYDIMVGTLVAGRNHVDLENIIGMFVNTLAIRIAYDDQQTFQELLEIVNNKVLNAFENQDYQFNDLVKLVDAGRDQRRNPLFDAMFVLQNIDMEELKIPGLKLKPCEMVTPVSKFDITLYCQEVAGGNYHFSIEYRTKLFKEEKIKRYSRYFEQIVGMVTENKYKKLEEMDIDHELSPIEFNTHNVKVEFNF